MHDREAASSSTSCCPRTTPTSRPKCTSSPPATAECASTRTYTTLARFACPCWGRGLGPGGTPRRARCCRCRERESVCCVHIHMRSAKEGKLGFRLGCCCCWAAVHDPYVVFRLHFSGPLSLLGLPACVRAREWAKEKHDRSSYSLAVLLHTPPWN